MARVLIVDDALFMRKVLSDIMSEAGHEVIATAGTAREGVEEYKRVQPDVVTMDIIMPSEDGTNGIDGVREIVRHDPNAKVIVVSAVGQDEMIVDAIRAGAADFITKPFHADNVKEVVNSLVGG